MKVLLDTHALLWWLSDDERLGAGARGLIADSANDILVSAASLWEIVVKLRVGKLDAEIAEVVAACERDRFTLLPIAPAHLQALAALPQHHRDPFDHLLIAQAIAEQAVFLSDDRHAAKYPLRVLSCADPPA
jgi:PIN domain nuclease of toxin-antitoxin system